jgi:excisionase family DNA binding protein
MTMTVAQAARELDLTPDAVRAAIRRGALPARKVLGRHRLDAAAVRRAAAGVPAQSKELRHADHDQPSSTAA